MKKILPLFSIVFLLFSCNILSQADNTEETNSYNTLVSNPIDQEGWSIIPPLAGDAIRIYVSSSQGSDDNDGLSEASPKATITEGYKLLRQGVPDQLLLKCGDQWEEVITLSVSGRSASEPLIISSYGTGDRPKIQGEGSMRTYWRYNLEHCWIIGLDFYDPYIDPDSPEYDPDYYEPEDKRPGSFSFVGGTDQVISDVLLEDCSFRFKSLGIQLFGGDEISNIRIRRCIVTDNYSTSGGHSQGIYMSHIEGLLIEETLFDHNGWLNQGGTGVDVVGPATMFNHNIYITGCDQVIYRDNLFLRGASMGSKFRSDHMFDSIAILLENNFYYGGELGTSIGGNDYTVPKRFAGVRVINNVFSQIGIDNPTSRNFSWGIDLVDVFDGLVSHNLFLDQPWYGNSHAVGISGLSTQDIRVEENLFYNINGSPILLDPEPAWSDIAVRNNQVDSAGQDFNMVRLNEEHGQVELANNRYFSNLPESFRFGNDQLKFADWQKRSGDRSSFTQGTGSYPDPGRNIADYDAFLGGDGSFDHFLDNARAQRKGQWNPAYTASKLNNYIRAGYGWDTLD